MNLCWIEVKLSLFFCLKPEIFVYTLANMADTFWTSKGQQWMHNALPEVIGTSPQSIQNQWSPWCGNCAFVRNRNEGILFASKLSSIAATRLGMVPIDAELDGRWGWVICGKLKLQNHKKRWLAMIILCDNDMGNLDNYNTDWWIYSHLLKEQK